MKAHKRQIQLRSGLFSFSRSRRNFQRQIGRVCSNCWTRKFLTVLGITRNKSTVRQEKLSVLHSHEAVEPVCPASLVVAETCAGDFKPLPFVSFDPLISKKCLALKMTVCTAEVLAEAVQLSQPATVFGRIPTGDQHPLIFVRTKIITRIYRVRFVHRFRCYDESLLLAGPPIKFQMTVAPPSLRCRNHQ